MPFDDATGFLSPPQYDQYDRSTIALLKNTHRRLLAGGWTQGQYGARGSATHCLVGWIETRDHDSFDIYRLLVSQMQRPYRLTEMRWRTACARDKVILWNDAKGRTKEQVLELLEQTIAKVEAKHAV